jgi:hypothetical protein
MREAFPALERVEFDASVDLWRAAPAAVRDLHAPELDVRVVGAAHGGAFAAARGARTAVTETGERMPDKPSASYRNILRAGFQERYLRQNWMSPTAKA